MSVGRLLGTEPLLVGGDLALDVDAQVSGARQALGVAHLSERGPRLVVHADHAAGRPLRRHVDSVADWALATHPLPRIRVANVLRVHTHPGVVSKHAERLANEEPGAPKGLVPCASAPMTTSNQGEK